MNASPIQLVALVVALSRRCSARLPGMRPPGGGRALVDRRLAGVGTARARRRVRESAGPPRRVFLDLTRR